MGDLRAQVHTCQPLFRGLTNALAKFFTRSESHTQTQKSGCEATIYTYTFLLYLIPCIVCNASYALGRTLLRFSRI